MKDIFQTVLVIINACSVIFFFGFHFGQFKQLIADVAAIRNTVETIDTKTDKNAIDIARLDGRVSAALNGKH